MSPPNRWSTTWSSDRNPLISVQLEEALRFLESGTVPHLRLALLLLDNACEVVMLRMCEPELDLNFLRGESGQLLRERADLADLTSVEQERLAWADLHMSNRQIRNLREFGGLVDLLAGRGYIDASMGAALVRMHNYRNETYHRDQLRTGSLRLCVLIYLDLTCELLSRYRPGMRLRGEETGQAVAVRLRARLGLDLPAVRTALVEHLLDRLVEAEETLTWICETLHSDRDLDAALAVAYLTAHRVLLHRQAEQPKPSEPSGKKPDPRRPPPPRMYTAAQMNAWRKQARGIEHIAGRDAVFTAFAALETEIDVFEAQVDLLGWSVSRPEAPTD